jgi:hypothetical protein
MDSRQSAATRILIVTEAIFVSTILGDPELTGISAVLFDEAHERHLDPIWGWRWPSSVSRFCARICALCPCRPPSTAGGLRACWAPMCR